MTAALITGIGGAIVGATLVYVFLKYTKRKEADPR